MYGDQNVSAVNRPTLKWLLEEVQLFQKPKGCFFSVRNYCLFIAVGEHLVTISHTDDQW